MSEYEEQDGDDAEELEQPDRPAKTDRVATSFQAQATRSLQRARKAVGDADEMSPMADYLMRSALVYAVLELADALRSDSQR